MTKRINTKEELKKISDIYTSPCANCITQEGCAMPVNCKDYKEWSKNKKKYYARLRKQAI